MSHAPLAKAAAAVGPLLIALDQAQLKLAARSGQVQALYPCTLHVHQGERLALVGANGSGKTSLLRLLHGLVQHQGSRTVQTLAGKAKPPRMAMVFQRPFALNASVQNNVRLALWLALWREGVPVRQWPARAQQKMRIQTALARVGLSHLAKRGARELSGGQLQRLAIARAWVAEPDIVFLDEPTASLDPSAKREVEALIDELATTGITVVMSTHNLGQAKRLASRVLYLEGGKILADQPVEAFFNSADLHPSAQDFLKGEMGWN